jgi:Major intrinsic protein
MSLIRRSIAETVGTALLLATVIGSGIMGERLAGGNIAIALLANTLATGAALVALILAFGPISGAHFNRKPGGDARARFQQYIRRNPPGGCPGIYPGATSWGCGGDTFVSLADAGSAQEH